MAWHAAHLLFLVRYCDGNQDSFTIWENVYLIEGKPDSDVWGIAEKFGMDSGGGKMTCDGRAARFEFVGVRRINECSRTDALENFTEVTYQQLEVATAEDLQRLIDARPVTIRLEYEDTDEL